MIAPVVGAMVTNPIKVDIWSDVACPWCYIGKRKFEAAVEAFPGEVEVEYHSYQLSPNTPTDYHGSHEDYLATHLGVDAARARQMTERVTGIAAQVGLAYDYDQLTTTNTWTAHELLHFAKAHGKQVELKEELLRSYFVGGGHVGDVDELVALAESIGLDGAAARAALESHEYEAAVRGDIEQAAAYGITGVPFFVFEEKYGVSGAQETATFASVLAQLADEQAKEKQP